MEYKFRDIESKWQEKWKKEGVYKVPNESTKPKFYVLDMFPYPSGVGLHVGHPLGYIASDIYARFKRLKGFNVLHPMGYDAFGLPAEQYAIDNGIHPAVSTAANIQNFRNQLDRIGFSFDWSREVRTCDPSYYKWTQWIFLQLFDSWFNRKKAKAERIRELVDIFKKEGNKNHPIPNSQFQSPHASFSATEWDSFDEKAQQNILMEYRLAYCGLGEVNWCEALGTVLANDEVINGFSERGGFPVVKKKLRQWYLRITEYADRLLDGLNQVDFSESMKEMQTNWIGKSYGAEIDFELVASQEKLRVYTTRPDTIFGVDFMVLAPEHELVEKITSAGQKKAVEDYVSYVNSRSERERIAEKKITGCFTGGYAINPFDKRQIPIWVSEYVLAGYGTGAIMAVPCGDERDFKFATHFNIPITNIIGNHFDGKEANPTKDAILENSDFLNGMVMRSAIDVVIERIESMRIGVRKVNYKMRDAAFSRQRYWGEPFPIVWKDDIAYPLDEKELPLELPQVDVYKAGSEGEGPLANIHNWISPGNGLKRESSTMPGYAGSSWYFLRYMNPDNEKEFCSRKASDYWGQVDLYIGGTEHAVGHLLYSRMWTKALYDLDYIGHDEPYKKLVNQGMIQGSSRFVYRVDLRSRNEDEKNGIDLAHDFPVFVSHSFYQNFEQGKLPPKQLVELVNDAIPGYFKLISDPDYSSLSLTPLYADVRFVDGIELDLAGFKKWKAEFEHAQFILEDGKYLCGTEVEKMSKSKFNTVDPNEIVDKYGADTFRMYEMFLGPVEQSKPWDTKGIEGVHRFLKKLWRLFFDDLKGKLWTNDNPSEAELKVLHRTIRKIEDDTERFSFNTAVSAFMIAVNELSDLQCNKRQILENLLILLAPFAPHISEELWSQLGHETTILDAKFPKLESKWLVESDKNYPVAINGKTRTELKIALDATQQQVEEIILSDEIVKKWLEGKPPKRIIYVKNKMINVVI
ncbi:MAG: leucine--tRNA ligase [Bacteroidetes bacterium]|nr:MAG: leucine--tRNA ligase [Bacteroidota bacterium]